MDTTKCGAGRHAIGQFNHAIDPHFVSFSSSLYTTTRNPNPNHNPTVITDPQIGPRDPQIVQIRAADPPRCVFCRVPVVDHVLLLSLERRLMPTLKQF